MAKNQSAESEIERLNRLLDEAAHDNQTLDDVALTLNGSNGHDRDEIAQSVGIPIDAPGPTLWARLRLATTDKGALLMNLDNVVRVMGGDPLLSGHIWYDEFLDSIVTDWNGPERKWADRDDIALQLYMQRHVGLHRIGLSTAHDAAKVAAFHNVKNEVKTYLNGLQWDGIERLQDMLADGFGAAKTAFTQAVGRCWMVSMVARVMQPGCKVDTVPVLEGEQGKRKSSALAVIGGKWFVECHESVMSKDFFGVLDGHILVEISEMHSFSRSEVERIKGIISCQVDRYRKAYGRHTEDHPRKTVLVGTTNRDDWHRDETGGRRFWPVRCGDIDIAWLEAQRDQIWAEAVANYKNGGCWWDVPVDEQQAEIEARRDADAWEPKIEEWLTGRDSVQLAHLMSECLEIPTPKQDLMLQRRIGRILRALGWQSINKRSENGRVFKMWTTK